MDRSPEDDQPSPTVSTESPKAVVEPTDERARRQAVDVILKDESTADVATDGGLSDAARTYLENTPDADLMDAYVYDKRCGRFEDADRAADLPPRGDVGDEQNYDRAEQSSRVQFLLRKFEEFEEQTE